MQEPWYYLVIVGAAILVYAWYLPKRTEPNPNELFKEIELTVERCLDNLQEDNQELFDMLAAIHEKQDQEMTRLNERIAHLERLQAMGNGQARAGTSESVRSEPGNEWKYTRDQTDHSAKQETIRARFPALFELHDEGKSVDAIAKSIGMNKGEVQLILRLDKREGQPSVEEQAVS